MLEPVIPEAELAERYGWKRQTARLNRILGKTPPYLKVGNRILYRVRDVEEWERVRRYTSTADATVRATAG